MRKNLLKIRYLGNKIVNEELKKIDNAEKCYRNYSFFNSIAVMLFIMSLIMIITAVIYQSLLIRTNETLVGLCITVFVFLSFISLMISSFYNSKTINLVKQYYNKLD